MSLLSFLFPSRPEVHVNLGRGKLNPDALIDLAEKCEHVASALRAVAAGE